MKQLLDEKLLSTDFTFGFELEAKERYWNKPIDKTSDSWDNFREYMDELGYDSVGDNLETIGDVEDYWSDAIKFDYDRETADAAIDKLYSYEDVEESVSKNEIFKKYFNNQKWIVSPSKGITYDGSLGLGGFEYRSPVMKLTPESVQTCIDFLLEVKKVFYVDEQCGFHTHLSFNGITEDDAEWITLKLAMSDEQIKDLEELVPYYSSSMEYEPIKMVSSRYSSDSYLYKLRGAIMGLDTTSVLSTSIENIAKLLSDEKYRLLRIHPQGTLEWRGPREFLNEDNSDVYVKSFFLKIYDFVNWMRRVLDENTLKCCDIDRKNLLDMIDSARPADKKLFSKRMTDSDKRLFDKIAKNPQTLFHIKNVNTTKLIKVLQSVVDDEFIKKINMFIDSGYKLDDKVFAILFVAASPFNQGSLLRHRNDDLPMKEIYEVFKRFSTNIYSSDATHMFIEKLKYLTENDIVNIVKYSAYTANTMEISLLPFLVKDKLLTNKVKKEILDKYGITPKNLDKMISNIKKW